MHFFSNRDLKTVRDPTGQGLQDIKAKSFEPVSHQMKHFALISTVFLASSISLLNSTLMSIRNSLLAQTKCFAHQNCKPGYLAKMISKGMSFNKERVANLLDETGLRRFVPKQEDLNSAIDFFRRNFDF